MVLWIVQGLSSGFLFDCVCFGCLLENHVLTLKPKVLVLDDDVLALELYSRELREDYQVITSESVLESRDYLKELSFDVLIIEPAINDDEGWGFLREIQTAGNSPAVVLCSVEDERCAGYSQGALAYLVKPVLPATLHILIDQITAKNHSNRNKDWKEAHDTN